MGKPERKQPMNRKWFGAVVWSWGMAIGVALFRRMAEPGARIDPMPPRRESSGAHSLEKSSPLGTGHGRSETSHARCTSFERATATDTKPGPVLSLYSFCAPFNGGLHFLALLASWRRNLGLPPRRGLRILATRHVLGRGFRR